MASPNSVFTEIVTTSLRAHRRELADNVSNNNAMMQRMMAGGRKRVLGGGYSIVEPLDYAENATYQRYSGYDVLNVGASDVLSAAEYQWKQSAVHVTASGLELRQNSGEEQLINLAQARIRNAMRTLSNKFSEDAYSDGTLANQMNGLQAIIPDTAGGTLGGINGGTFTFWQAVVQSAAAPLQGGGAVTLSATTFEPNFLLPAYIECSRGGDEPNLIVLSGDYWIFFEAGLTPLREYTSQSASAGFTSLRYKNAEVVFDSGASGASSPHASGIPASHGYLTNTDFLGYVTHRDADMTEVPEQRSHNQDAVVIPIISQHNLTCSNRSVQGVLKA